MAEKKNATCSICGKKYHKCLSCKDKMKAEPWKMYTCTSSHYQVYQILRGYNIGVYTKDEAKVRLQNIDLSDLNNFQDAKKKLIKEIMKEDKKALKLEKVVEVEELVATEVVEANVADESAVDTQVSSYISRRKKSFNQEDSE